MNILVHLTVFALFMAFIIAMGRGILHWLEAGEDRENFTSWMPVSFLLGSLAITLTCLPLSILNLRTQPWMLLIPAGIIAGLCLNKKRSPQLSGEKPLAEAAMFSAFALLLLLNFLVAITYPQFDIDMIGHILMKGKIIADSSYARSFYFHDPVFATAMGTYPPLTVFLHGFMARIGLGSIADYQALNTFVLLLLGMGFYSALQPRIGRPQSFAWCFILLSTAEYIRNQFILSSTDMFLALALLMTARTFLRLPSRAPARAGTLFSLLCACSLLVKNDAGVFIILISIGLWLKDRRLPWQHLLAVACLTGPWILFRSTLPSPSSGGEFMVSRIFAYLSASNLPVLGAISMTVLTKCFYLLLLFAPLVWALFIRGKDLHILMVCASLTAAAYIIYVWGMIPLADGYDMPGLIRLLTHTYPLILLATALGLGLDRKQE